MLISKEAFKAASSETKLLLIYDLMNNHNNLLEDHISSQTKTCEMRSSNCNKRFLSIERRKIFDTGVATATGIIGGFLAVIIKSVVWK